VSDAHFFPRRRAEAVAGILQRTLDRHGLSRRLDRHVPTAVWAEAVGAELAARAQPTVLSAGTLHVLVQDHRWRDQIDAARSLVIERLNRRLGRNVVRALQFGLAHEGALRPIGGGPVRT
jgi:predicted nucleic acid-binding Zn ribbon protein